MRGANSPLVYYSNPWVDAVDAASSPFAPASAVTHKVRRPPGTAAPTPECIAMRSDDTLSHVLRSIRLRGAVFFYVSCGENWAAEAPSG